MPLRTYFNPTPVHTLDSVPPPDPLPRAFHRRLPGYAPTPLVDAPALAARLGIGRLWIKDESHRLGLPAFKILGASWAIYRALSARLGTSPEPWATPAELRARLSPLLPLTLATATDGNHGRAVAHMAALLGCEAAIFVPAGTVAARIAGIASEGAVVTVVEGSYDDAVALAAAQAGDRCLVISDTSWPGYEDIPRWVIEGYSTLFAEVDDQLAQRGEPGPDLVVVQIGVGALAAAVVAHYRRPGAQPPARILGVEPTHAACVLASLEAGQLVTVSGPQDSIMAGLNCGTPSPVALPLLARGLDACVAIEDDWAVAAMRALAEAGITAGETGASGLGGLLALIADADASEVRNRLGLTPATRALVLVTEGATDPDAYARLVPAPAR